VVDWIECLDFCQHSVRASANFSRNENRKRSGWPRDGGGRDSFYDGDPAILEHLRRHRIVGVEMEAAGLYALAQREGVQALAILTVSDHLETDAHLSGDEREQGLGRMATLALECAAH